MRRYPALCDEVAQEGVPGLQRMGHTDCNGIGARWFVESTVEAAWKRDGAWG